MIEVKDLIRVVTNFSEKSSSLDILFEIFNQANLLRWAVRESKREDFEASQLGQHVRAERVWCFAQAKFFKYNLLKIQLCIGRYQLDFVILFNE